jgi:hypothetical protein
MGKQLSPNKGIRALIFGSLLVMSILSTSNVQINYMSENKILLANVANRKSNAERGGIQFTYAKNEILATYNGGYGNVQWQLKVNYIL